MYRGDFYNIIFLLWQVAYEASPYIFHSAYYIHIMFVIDPTKMCTIVLRAKINATLYVQHTNEPLLLLFLAASLPIQWTPLI